MANSYHNRFSLLGTHISGPQRPPPPKATPVGTNTLTDLNFKLSKTYFKLLQSIHHTEILAEALSKGAPPLGMAKKVAHLTAFIKPAAPDDTVLTLIKNNTITWMNNNLHILIEHYAGIQKDLIVGLGPFNGEALERALRWAHQRYGRRLTPSSITSLRSLLFIPKNSSPPTIPPLISDTVAFPPLPTRPQVTLKTLFKHRNTLILPSRPLPIPPLLSLPPFSLSLTRRPPPPSTSTSQPSHHNRLPLPQRLPTIRSRPPSAIPPVQTTLIDTGSPQPTLVTVPKSPTSDLQPLTTVLTSSTPKRLSLGGDLARVPFGLSTSISASTPPPPPRTEDAVLGISKQIDISKGVNKQPNPVIFSAEIHPCPDRKSVV